MGVHERFIDWYWRTVSMAIMNVPLQACSAGALLGFFRYMAGRGRQEIGLPTLGLGDLFVPSATRWIETRGGRVQPGTTVGEFLFDDGRVSGVRQEDGSVLHARWTVAAVPPASLLALLPERMRGQPLFRHLAGFAPSPYISTYLWFAEHLTDERFWANVWSSRTCNYDFYDLANIRPGWTRGSLIACNLIHSDRAAHLDDAALVDVARSELAGHVPAAARATLLHATVHPIPMAIVAPHPGSERLRPGPDTPVRGLFVAGDWLATGLPSSMESAVRGGWLAAERVLAEAGRPKTWAQPLPRMQGLAALVGGRAPA
jgi:15-cis-phytoene desaturase